MTGKKHFYGWVMAVVCGILYLCSSGSVLSSAQLINPAMLKDPAMEMTGTVMGTGFTVFVIFQGLASPLAGWLNARLGARLTVVIGGTLGVISALALALFVRGTIGYFIFFGCFLSIATILVGQITIQSTVGIWFNRHRGKAMTLAMAIGRLGAFIAPIAVGTALALGDYRNGWYLMAALGVLSIILALLFVKNKPADLGQYPDGITPQEAARNAADSASAATSGAGAQPAGTRKSKVFKNTTSVTYRQAIKNPCFWLIAFAGSGGFFSYGFTTSAGVLHFTTQGFDPALIVSATALLGLALMVGVFFIGMLSDRIEPIRLITAALTLIIIALLTAAFVNATWVIFFYYICIGVCFGSISTNLPTAVANYFGPASFPKNLGTTMLFSGLITSWAGAMAGAVYDANGTLILGFIIAASFISLSLIASLVVRFPKPDHQMAVGDKTRSGDRAIAGGKAVAEASATAENK
ncbi:MAG: MFS transporter [Coriobacteriales bacterium]|jgi:MFS family permease|nr:MFS transporter [Coriobacteriales bacterium]